MIRKTFCALGAVLLIGSGAGASDIRRVVTGLDANNKSVVMFDTRMPLQSGPLGLSASSVPVPQRFENLRALFGCESNSRVGIFLMQHRIRRHLLHRQRIATPDLPVRAIEERRRPGMLQLRQPLRPVLQKKRDE